MERIPIQPRPDWQTLVESQGFHFHTLDEQPYWDESAYYRFSAKEVDAIEAATYALDKMCLDAVERIVSERLFDRFGIAPEFHDYVANSWETEELTIYGRFDLAFDGTDDPKLLEYNADTPTSLLEASVIQWHWMQDRFKELDQFNSIHEKLIDAWLDVKASWEGTIYFSSLQGIIEDFMNVSYLRDTAMQAGLATEYLAIERIGWNHDRRLFVDERECHIANCFKLYPWEWMLGEQFGPYLRHNNTRWLEAPWKMLLSNKAILAVIYEMFPHSPYLLPAAFEPGGAVGDSFVRKPLLSREGANITIVQNGKTLLETQGIYGGPHVYQKLARLPSFGGNYPVIGSWMVGGYACGMGIREDTSPVTQNMSRFVPHVFAPV